MISTAEMSSIESATKSIDSQLKQGKFCGYRRPIKLSLLEELFKNYGNQIFHIAAKYNYDDLTSVLIDYEIGKCTVKDSKGMTPLITAITNENFEVAEVLYDFRMQRIYKRLNLSEESCTLEKVTKLRYQLNNHFVSKLKKQNLSSEQIGKVLAKITKYELTDIVYFRDIAMTEAFLKLMPTKVTCNMTFQKVGADLEHTLVILRNAPRYNWYRNFCEYIIDNICRLHKSKSGRKFLRGIFTPEVFGEEKTLNYLEEILKSSEKKNMKVFLKYNLQSLIKASCGRDILASFFGKCRSDILSCLKDEHMDVDGRGFEGKTPLHFAAEIRSINKVKFLLKRGADSNALDSNGNKPLSSAIFEKGSDECIELLLAYGGNPLAIIDGIKKIDSSKRHSFYNNYLINKKLVMAQVIIQEALGKMDREYEKLLILLKHDDSEKYIEKCRTQLIELKKHKIRDTDVCNFEFSVFTILTGNLGILARYVSKEDLQKIRTFLGCNEEILIPYYRNLLIIRVEGIAYMQSCREKTLRVVGQFIGIPDPHHLIVNKIVDYLDDRDLRKLSVMDKNDVPFKLSKTDRFFKLTRQYIPRILVKS